jgi:hypothetical protein
MPFILMVLVYIIFDPFMVLHRYDDFNKKIFIPKNRDYISSEMYLNNWETNRYDSFIFGSSTALFIKPSVWKEYLSESSSLFSFDASRENFFGMWSKVRYIDKQEQPINNALFVIDVDYPLCKPEKENVLFTKHYRIFGTSWIDFQYRNFIKVLDFNFLRSVISYSLYNEFKPYMASCLIEDDTHLDPVTNEYHSFSIKDEFESDSISYYEKRRDRFPPRSGSYVEHKSMMTSEYEKLLEEMGEILKRNGTNFKIIISPNFEQIAFNRSDLEVLQRIFGKDNIFDFSGINRFSEEKSNFYDGLHFKEYVGREFLDIIYSEDTGKSQLLD